MQLAPVLELTVAALTVPSLFAAVVWRPVRRATRKVGLILDDWAGEAGRPGVPARPGVMERLATIEANQNDVRAESQSTRNEVRNALMQQEKRTAAVLADMDVNLTGALDHIEQIHREVTPNGGGSLKDQVTRVDATLNPGSAKSNREEH